MTVVITTCTNRKRKPVAESLRMSSLPAGDIDGVGQEWAARLAAEVRCYPARTIYGGRAFQEAVAAANALDARLLVVSAGLGLIDAAAAVPPYSCTVLVGAVDGVPNRVTGSFSNAQWWSTLCLASPFGLKFADAVSAQSGLILAALSETYLNMVAEELCALPESDRARLRIFTRAPISRVSPAVQSFVMPYDIRLDGPDSSIPGTGSDFASRALHHFAGKILKPNPDQSLHEQREAVRSVMSGWRVPSKPNRARYDNTALLATIRAHWDAAGGNSSRLLRLLRDELNVACEQARFAALARTVRDERR